MGKSHHINSATRKQETENCWIDIWKQDTSYNSTTPWIQQKYERTAEIKRRLCFSVISHVTKAAAIKKTLATEIITGFEKLLYRFFHFLVITLLLKIRKNLA